MSILPSSQIDLQPDHSSASSCRKTESAGEPPMTCIAITGTMGSGKSSVSALLKEWMPVTDCDQINAALLEPGQPGYQALMQAGVLQVDDQGTLDKPAQAAAMFSDPAYKAKVESILHPMIRQAVQDWAYSQKGLCAVEVPLLFESGMESDFDEIWCVTCSLPTALQRLQQGRGIDAASALARIEHQMDAAAKCARSQVVLVNDGTLDELRQQIVSNLEHKGWISAQQQNPDTHQ